MPVGSLMVLSRVSNVLLIDTHNSRSGALGEGADRQFCAREHCSVRAEAPLEGGAALRSGRGLGLGAASDFHVLRSAFAIGLRGILGAFDKLRCIARQSWRHFRCRVILCTIAAPS